MTKRKTAGELSLKAASDSQTYDPLEVGYALTDGMVKELFACAHRHKEIFGENEYFVVLQVAGDCLIQGIRRHKYYADLFMPSPRPEQAVFLYNKGKDSMKRLWSLPNAASMALISEKSIVDKKWIQTKRWVDAFYKLKFWETIRDQYKFNHLSRMEYINLHREELVKAGAKDGPPLESEAFDFSKIKIDHIIDTKTAHVE